MKDLTLSLDPLLTLSLRMRRYAFFASLSDLLGHAGWEAFRLPLASQTADTPNMRSQTDPGSGTLAVTAVTATLSTNMNPPKKTDGPAKRSVVKLLSDTNVSMFSDQTNGESSRVVPDGAAEVPVKLPEKSAAVPVRVTTPGAEPPGR